MVWKHCWLLFRLLLIHLEPTSTTNYRKSSFDTLQDNLQVSGWLLVYLIHNNQPKWPPRTSKLLKASYKAGCKADRCFCYYSSTGALQTLQICEVLVLISKKLTWKFQIDWLCPSYTTINQSWLSGLTSTSRASARLIVVSILNRSLLVSNCYKFRKFEFRYEIRGSLSFRAIEYILHILQSAHCTSSFWPTYTKLHFHLYNLIVIQKFILFAWILV